MGDFDELEGHDPAAEEVVTDPPAKQKKPEPEPEAEAKPSKPGS